MGRTLRDAGTPALPWCDLLVIVRHLPPDSALGRELTSQDVDEAGDTAWDLQAHLLAGIYDVLSLIYWGLFSGKKADRPRPVPRPGLRPKRFGHVLMTLDEASAFMARRRAGR